MPRGPRFDIPGIVYHVICRGIERREIFKDARDYRYLLDRLSYLTSGGEVTIYAFCLMPNHIHLLVKPLKINLATLMRRLLTSYAIYFNKKHKRVGHLFQNRYISFSVQDGTYFLELLRYIHLNPVKASIVENLASLSLWPYSGYSALMGKITYKWFEVDETLLLFAEKKSSARRILSQFMKEGLLETEAERPIEDSLKQCYLTEAGADSKRENVLEKRIIGDSAFAEQALSKLEAKTDSDEKEIIIKRLLEKVASFYHLTIPELCSGSKRPSVAKARAAVVFIASRDFSIPPKMLACALGVGAKAIYEIIRLQKGEKESMGISLE